MPVHKFQSGPGFTRGAATGEEYRWEEGDEIEAPEGEFRHLSPGMYETRPSRPAKGSEETESKEPREDGAHHTGSGWYDIVVGGEKVDRERGKEAAQERYQELTSET